MDLDVYTAEIWSVEDETQPGQYKWSNSQTADVH